MTPRRGGTCMSPACQQSVWREAAQHISLQGSDTREDCVRGTAYLSGGGEASSSCTRKCSTLSISVASRCVGDAAVRSTTVSDHATRTFALSHAHGLDSLSGIRSPMVWWKFFAHCVTGALLMRHLTHTNQDGLAPRVTACGRIPVPGSEAFTDSGLNIGGIFH